MNDQSNIPGYIPPNSQGFDFDPFDSVVTQPLQKVAAAADDNPDDAARAVGLEKATGVAAPVIADDLKSFEQIHKTALANQIMRSNPQLVDYVRRYPMAASVSNDDWANLAGVSKASSRLNQLLAVPYAAASGALAGAEEGFAAKPAMQQSIDDWYADKPLAWAVASAAAFAPEGVVRGFNALMGAQFGAVRGGAAAAYKAVTGDAERAEDFGEDAVEAANVMLAGSMAGAEEGSSALGAALAKADPTSLTGEMLRQREAFIAGKPWFEAGQVPPRGVHPGLDQALGALNEEGVARLEDVLKASQSSSTRERSYEMFNNFVSQQHGDATIGIHGPAVATLYGSRVPESGDGLLGFAPGIGDQLLAANISGDDVHIPVKDWLANVTPEVAAQLHDDVRMFQGGITKREAAEPLAPKVMLDAPLPQVRGTSGLEPRFALGDRKLTLEPNLSFRDYDEYQKEFGLDHFVSSKEDFERDELIGRQAQKDLYWLTDSAGNRAGEMSLFPDPAKKELYVDWIGLWGHESDVQNTLGPASVRDVLRQLKEKYPGYTLTGDRVSGARAGPARGEGEALKPQVRLALDDVGDKATPSNLREVDNKWRQIGNDTWAKLSDAVDTIAHQELRRIVGQFPELVPAEELRLVSGAAAGRSIAGVIQPRYAHPPTIAWNALNPDATGIVRHEAIHYLRRYGFFTPDEWAELGWNAVQNNWLDRYNIRGRYTHLDVEGQVEEAVAEAYRHWAKGEPEIGAEPTGLVARAFQRMKDLWGAIKDRLRDMFGQDVDAEDLFRSVHEGRIARRGPTGEPPVEGVLMPKFSEESGLVVARRKADGSIQYGKPGEVHFDLIKDADDLRGLPGTMEKYNDLRLDDLGFARPGGPFMTRQEAVDWVNKNEPKEAAKLKYSREGLEAGEYKSERRAEPEARYSISDEAFQNLKASAVGLDAKSYGRLRDAIKARYESDLVAAVERAERQQRQAQSAEWRANIRGVRAEVERTIKQRPDVASDLFVNSGEFEGRKLRQRIPLRADDLSEEQKASLPDAYYSKSGLPVADVARLFGYQDGQHLAERLSVMVAQRGDRTPQEHLRQLIEDETQLRMERQHGRLEDNIMEAASDQALSDTDVNLLAEEYHAAGMLAGKATIDKNVIKAQVQSDFSKLPVGSISSQRLMTEMARHDRDAERALIPGQEDPVAALQSMERKVYTGMMAAEARRVEKEMKQFDKTGRRLNEREVSNLPQSYTNFIHQILASVGKPIGGRTPLDLRTEIAGHGAEHTLEGFVADLQNNGQETAVWDKLFDPTWTKPYRELTVDEFRKVKDSVDSLNFIGKNVKKITSAGVKAELADKKAVLIESLESFAKKHYDEEGRGLGPLPPGIWLDLPRTFLANSLTLETVFGRWDHFDPFGPWTQWGLRDLIDANGEEHSMRRDVAGKLTAIYEADKADGKMKDPVYNPLFRDTIGGELRKFDRSNLRAVMLNTGSRGSRRANLTYLSEGHGLKPEQILDWIDQNATKEDWDWCQKIWDLFKDELWEPAQQMRRSLNGIGAKSLEVPPIQTKFGEYAGGYYPVIFSEAGKQSKRSLEKGLFGQDYTRATTWEGYAQERTGAYAPLRLDLEPMAARIGQIVHDIKMRPAVLNAAKLFYDSDIKMAIARHYGKEYADLLEPYLRDVAGSAKYRSKAVEVFDKATDTIQRNMVVSLIGLNPGTVAKHSPTALALSLTEVGPKDFVHAVQSLFSTPENVGESNYRMIMGKLDTLQNRSRTWSQTITGAADEFVPGGTMRSFKQKVVEWSSKPIALSDMMSALPTGLAAYQRAIKDGRNEGDAIFLANRAVRRAHGDASVTNRSGVQRALPKAITTFYTFFNDMLNRRAEVVWRAADALGVTGNHTWAQARAEVRPIAAGLFSTVLFTAFIEQMISPIQFKPDDSRAKKAAQILAKDQSAGLVVARDIVNWWVEGRDPSLGLYSTAFHEFGDAIKDVAKVATQRQHMSKEQAGKIIRDSAAFAGVTSGLVPLEVGKAAQFVYGTHVGTEHPRGGWGWATGLRYGTLKGHSPTFERWRKER